MALVLLADVVLSIQPNQETMCRTNDLSMCKVNEELARAQDLIADIVQLANLKDTFNIIQEYSKYVKII